MILRLTQLLNKSLIENSMLYPLISEYIKAIKAAEYIFKELANLYPVLGEDGQPIMSSSNFAVVLL